MMKSRAKSRVASAIEEDNMDFDELFQEDDMLEDEPIMKRKTTMVSKVGAKEVKAKYSRATTLNMEEGINLN